MAPAFAPTSDCWEAGCHFAERAIPVILPAATVRFGPMAHDPRARNPLGDYIRQQREMHELSMRQFAKMSGISNPYLSQIERGQREPSRRVVEDIAHSLQMSVDALYAQAGVEPERAPEPTSVRAAIEADPDLLPGQRRALVEIYLSLRESNRRAARSQGDPA
jgi:transcriptional regulator with XRE-family HTH domain